MEILKVGFSTVIYEDSKLSYEEIIGKARTYGYDGVELNFKEWPTEIDASKIQRVLVEHDVSLLAIGTRYMFQTHGLYLSSQDKSKRERGVEYILACANLAVELGSNLIQMGLAFQGSRLDVSKEEAWKNSVNSFREIARLLPKDMRIVIEPINRFEAKLIPTIGEAIKLLNEVGCDRMFSMADTFHMNIEETSMTDSIRDAGGRIGYVHFSDNNRLSPGRGHTDFSSIVKALREIGYDGSIVIECLPQPSADEAVRVAREYVKRLVFA